MKKYLLILGLIGLISFSNSCSKDDDNGVVALSKTEMIARTWKISTLNVTMLGVTVNALDSLQDCMKDNIYKFTAAGIYSSEEGLTKCNESDPTVIETGTWQFVLNESKLRMNVNSWDFPDGEIPWSDEIIWDIVYISTTKTELKYVIPASGSLPEIKVEMTFSAL